MIKSMTGYGKAVASLPKGNLTIEIRTLNGKSCDISLKSSLLPRDKDLMFRQIITQSLQRGTIDVLLTWESKDASVGKAINKEVVNAYMSQLEDLCWMNSIPKSNERNTALLAAALRLPDVVDASRTEIMTDEDWPAVEKALQECLETVNDYRSREGEILYKDVTSRVDIILGLYDEVEKYEYQRIEATREKLLKALEDLHQKVDENRFEQEMIYYLEKLDINEEKVRLRQHCKYFMETIDGDPMPGKKLGFIIQEMGREINTTGSKANFAPIQQLVVQMKDHLEKAREQSMNIL